jgi:hypothetical protein
MIEKISLNTPTDSETHRNEFSSGFRSLGTGTLTPLESIVNEKYLVFSTYFLLLKQFITKENIHKNFLDEQMVDVHQDLSICQN